MAQRDRLTRSQKANVNRMLIDFDRLWATYSTRPPVEFEAALQELLPPLVDMYGRLAGSAAADWYEETRARALVGTFEALVQRANLTAVRKSVHWLGGQIHGGDLATVKDRTAASLERHVRNAGRDTIMHSIVRDPARPRWARAMRGTETCGWCRMLASRGFVYGSEESAGGLHEWHDRDDCEIIPDFSLTDAERAAYDREVAGLYAQYEDVKSRLGPHPTDEEIAAEWDASMIDYAKVHEQLAKHRTGKFASSGIDRAEWDGYRGELLDRLSREFPDGYVGTNRLPPRNPSLVPANWSSTLPDLTAERLAHILYGDHDPRQRAEGRAGGGHLFGMGWVNPYRGDRRSEFPRSWDAQKICDAIETTIRANHSRVTRRSTEYELVVDGVPMLVAVREVDGERVITAYPTTRKRV